LLLQLHYTDNAGLHDGRLGNNGNFPVLDLAHIFLGIAAGFERDFWPTLLDRLNPLLDRRAGYHIAAALTIPENVTLVRLPPYAPELNPLENVWEYLRGNKLAITVFDDYDDSSPNRKSVMSFETDSEWKPLTAVPGRSEATAA
jgi:transposase